MIYDYTLTTGKGGELNLADYKGKVILIVNTATGCGFTPQYAPIEQLYRDYHDQGLEIVDIPCNQFGAQAPGTDDEIHEFCSLHYNTTFPQMKKSDVNGENELPLYTYLKSQKGFEGFTEHPYKALLEKMFAEADPEWDKKPDIKWNFTKFVVNRKGEVVARFEPTADMAEVEACVKALLAEDAESGLEKVCRFLEEAGTYYLATVDGDQPRVRPFGTVLCCKNRLYIQTGKIKDVSHQLAANPKAEICAFKDGVWLRVAGKLINDDDRDVKVAMLEKMPSLKAMYSADDDNTQVLYFEDAVATFNSFTAAPETVCF